MTPKKGTKIGNCLASPGRVSQKFVHFLSYLDLHTYFDLSFTFFTLKHIMVFLQNVLSVNAVPLILSMNFYNADVIIGP